MMMERAQVLRENEGRGAPPPARRKPTR